MSTGTTKAPTTQEALELMHQMGASSFDPMPPSQHAYLMDRDQPLQNRHIGWCFSKTIHPTPNDSGKGFKRWARCHDERGWLQQHHAATDLGVHLSATVKTFTVLAEQGRIRIDEKKHIWVRGDVQKPNLVPRGEEIAKENGDELCTYILPQDLLVHFQSLDSQRRAQYTRDWISIQEHEKRMLRDAAAEVRAKVSEIEERWREAIGFKREQARGRPTEKSKGKRPEPAVQLELKALPNLSVHITPNGSSKHSVQNENGHVYTPENGSEQKAASLSPSRVNESSESEVNPACVENPPLEQEKVAPAHPAVASSGLDETLPDEVTEQTLVRRALEDSFHHKLRTTDTLPAQFLKLGKQLGIPARALVMWIHDKMSERKGMGYHVSSPGALLRFATEDLPKWIKLNRALISNMVTAETREATARCWARGAAAGAGGDDEPFEPTRFTAEMRELRKKDKGGW
jgi:hypothetical protein